MKISLLGATGFAGSALFTEATNRGHHIVALTRNPEKVPSLKNVTAKAVDAQDGAALAHAIEGTEAVIVSIHFLQQKLPVILGALKRAGVPRLLVVGGAGSLEVAPGVTLIETPQFPAEYKAEAQAGADYLRELRKEKDLAWTFLSPGAFFVPGPRTGAYKLGGDQLIVNSEGKSQVSIGDFAIAMIDELERPKHTGQRFSVVSG